MTTIRHDGGFQAPHRVLVVAMRPGDELRALQGLLAMPQSSIAEVCVLFMARDGMTWRAEATNDTLTNRAGEAKRVLDSLGVARIMYLGSGVARARGTAPHSYQTDTGVDAHDGQHWDDANLLDVIADATAAFRAVTPDTVIVAGTTSTNAENTSAVTEEQHRLNHVVDIVASKLEPEGFGRETVYKDGTIAHGHTSMLVLDVVDTNASVRRRNRKLLALVPGVAAAKPLRSAIVPARQVAMRVVTDTDGASTLVKVYEQYRSRYRVDRHDDIPVIRDVSGAFLPSNTVSFVERRGRAIPLAAPAVDLDAWRVFPNDYVQQRSGIANVGIVVGGILGGAMMASVASIWHQFTVGVIPVGLLVGATVMLAMLVGLRLSDVSSKAILAWAGGMIIAITIIAFSGQWGDVLLPANALSFVWAYGVPIAVALVAVWPHRRS